MITAAQLRKGTVVTLDGAHWIVEDYRTHQSAKRHSVLHVKLRNMKTGHVAEKSLDEAEHLEQPDVESRRCRFLYAEPATSSWTRRRSTRSPSGRTWSARASG
jgi:translation elongation factor P/translation initiation factor 5A